MVYAVAIVIAAAVAVWLVAKMTRTEEADRRVIIIGAVVLAGAVGGAVGLIRRRGARDRGRGES